MKYFEKSAIDGCFNDDYRDMIALMKNEVAEFATTFDDDPKRTSRWGHHYFCPDDGGLLIYDRNKPIEHECSICHKVYSNDLLNGVWTYMYRNEAILTIWKSAFLYKYTSESKYLDIVKELVDFYASNYLNFVLHNKEGEEFETLEEAHWGCGRIMPQGLNESLGIIRMINGLELVKDELDATLMDKVSSMLREIYVMLKPQVVAIHNISCWYDSAIGTMGLFLNDQEMIDFAFNGEFNVRRQLREGVTEDGFWYEGSIHYNFFTLEGMTNLLLFSRLYDYDFGEEEKIIDKMLCVAYKYAFDDHQFPNPNDGWPDVNLKSYSYIYSIASKVFGKQSKVYNITKAIINKEGERGVFPLSKPYYYQNKISLERLILIPDIQCTVVDKVETPSVLFESTNMALLKDKENDINVFLKYGHNGPSHAHLDKMNIEVTVKNHYLTRDLSNSGYGNQLCNEWHRQSLSHNTVVVDGLSHESTERGECLDFANDKVSAMAKNVYANTDFYREVNLTSNGFNDVFKVKSDKLHHYDYFFHLDAQLVSNVDCQPGSLKYADHGYQHISDVKEIITKEDYIELVWDVNGQKIISRIKVDGGKLFLVKTPDNPVINRKTSIIISKEAKDVSFEIEWILKED